MNLLADEDQLTAGQLSDCWLSSCKHAEAEFREEVHTLLVGLSPSLTTEMYASLMATVQASMSDHFSSVVGFVEKLAQEGVMYIRALPTESSAALLQLLWGLYKVS